jgi:N-acetylglucosamine repressor
VRRLHLDPMRVARRGLSREINRRIALDLVRRRQPLSRADLARLMGVRRGAVSLIVNDIIAEGLLFEGAKGETARGRKPKFLYVDSRRRSVIAVDVRPTRTSLMATDLLAAPIVGVSGFSTEADPKRFVRTLADRIGRLVTEPGMVDSDGERVLYAPRLGWRDVPLGEMLAAQTGLTVHIENSGRACALAQVWSSRDATDAHGDIVFVSVSDGLGVGVVVNGELMRGRHNVAGEFGHTPLTIDGPPCACGAFGCWEAHVSNLATLSRYFGRELSPHKPIPEEIASFSMDDLIARARGGDGKANAALQATAHYLGLGFASLVNAIDPARIYVGGEIVAVWDLVEVTVRQALASRVLAPASADVEIVQVPLPDYPRLRGAAALVAARVFAAPQKT